MRTAAARRLPPQPHSLLARGARLPVSFPHKPHSKMPPPPAHTPHTHQRTWTSAPTCTRCCGSTTTTSTRGARAGGGARSLYVHIFCAGRPPEGRATPAAARVRDRVGGVCICRQPPFVSLECTRCPPGPLSFTVSHCQKPHPTPPYTFSTTTLRPPPPFPAPPQGGVLRGQGGRICASRLHPRERPRRAARAPGARPHDHPGAAGEVVRGMSSGLHVVAFGRMQPPNGPVLQHPDGCFLPLAALPAVTSPLRPEPARSCPSWTSSRPPTTWTSTTVSGRVCVRAYMRA
jgi:hypothetical protein